jgi:hypothetical protein
VAAVAGLTYSATLLPGVDFGDTGSFQTAIGDLALTPRQAYPLYYAVGNLVYALVGGDPAHALNLTSALCGAAACGVLTWLAAGLTGSLVAGVAGGLLLAASYTFWSQAVIAEVYTLHLLMSGLVLSALIWWSRRPSRGRLTVVFAVYALAFGNHLMTILLAPAIVLYVLATPGGARLLLAPRTILIAVLCAAAGAAQYLWNASYFWTLPVPPDSFAESLRTFWFDVTKADWRSTMVLGVHESALKRREAMYWFDVRQQIGMPGLALAGIGLCWLSATRWRFALLLVSTFVPAFVFAYTYNVGDAHVFFLPSHQALVIFAAAGVAALLRLATGRAARWAAPVLASALLCYPVWRMWDTWPAVDRHDDQRPTAWLQALTSGLDDRTLLVADVNWQLENGLEYYVRRVRPDLNVVRASDRLLTLPFLLRDNAAGGRQVVMTPDSRARAEAAYGGLFAFDQDPQVAPADLVAQVRALPAGTPYVLAVLAPYRDLRFDSGELAAAAASLTGGAASLPPGPSYQVMAGLTGRPPEAIWRDEAPFRRQVVVGGLPLELRMESWLPMDTMRRAGFGHIVLRHRHVFTLERGVNLAAFDGTGQPILRAYASSLFRVLPRFRVRMP